MFRRQQLCRMHTGCRSGTRNHKPIQVKIKKGDFEGRTVRTEIVDLGNSCFEGKPFTEEIQTIEYRSPEVILRAGYCGKADIWSLGITAIELAQMEPPLFDVTPAVRVLFLIPSRPPPTLAEPARWSSAFVNFVSSCLVKDPNGRPDASRALDQAVGDALNGPQRVLVRDFLAAQGFERP